MNPILIPKTDRSAPTGTTQQANPSQKRAFEIVNATKEAKSLRDKLDGLQRTSAATARELGRILFQLKGKLPHGDWETFLKEQLNLKIRAVRNYIRIWSETKHCESINEYYETDHQAHVQLVTAHIAGGLNKALADRPLDPIALDISEKALTKLLSFIQQQRKTQ